MKCATEKKWTDKNLACKLGLHAYKVIDGSMTLIPVTPASLICHNITIHRYIYNEKCKKCCKKRVSSY
jgi:hypothetical protein